MYYVWTSTRSPVPASPHPSTRHPLADDLLIHCPTFPPFTMTSRPSHTRTLSTNLGGNASQRPLEGRVAIVTGAARGIGVEIARHLASKGCHVVVNYTSDSSTEAAQELAAELAAEHGIQAVSVQADMGSENGPQHLVDVAKNKFQHPKTGKFQLDIIVNNAGVAGNKLVEQVDCDDFARQFNVNVRGPLLLVQAAIPHLPTDRSGRIVNLSSVSSSLGYKGQSIYGGTKAALESMTRTWSRELAERCTVNAVNPGPVATDMYWGNDEAFLAQNKPFIENTPLAAPRKGVDGEKMYEAAQLAGGRPAYSEEVAGVVGMLCLPEAGWTTGSVICANGGMKFTA